MSEHHVWTVNSVNRLFKNPKHTTITWQNHGGYGGLKFWSRELTWKFPSVRILPSFWSVVLIVILIVILNAGTISLTLSEWPRGAAMADTQRQCGGLVRLQNTAQQLLQIWLHIVLLICFKNDLRSNLRPLTYARGTCSQTPSLTWSTFHRHWFTSLSKPDLYPFTISQECWNNFICITNARLLAYDVHGRNGIAGMCFWILFHPNLTFTICNRKQVVKNAKTNFTYVHHKC